MVSFLVAYGTGEGQTAKVAERIAGTLHDRGHEATVVDVGDVGDVGDGTAAEPDGDAASPPALDPTRYDAVIVGSSIHVGTHQSEVRAFVEDERAALADRPTAFFQLSLSSATDDEERQAEAAGYVDAFVEATGWHPDRIGLFGGALRYSEYGFLKRLLMKRIAKEATGDTDTARDYEYTDWTEVEAFANDVAAFVEGRLGVAPVGEADEPGS